jgi:hypothetical protein
MECALRAGQVDALVVGPHQRFSAQARTAGPIRDVRRRGPSTMVPSLQSPNPVRWSVQRIRRALTEADAAGASNSECPASAAAAELPLVAVPTQLMENDYPRPEGSKRFSGNQ